MVLPADEGAIRLTDAARRSIAATVRVAALTQAILAKAFRGELVPTEAELARQEGRTYETGAELLGRIRVARGDKETPKKPAKVGQTALRI